MTSSLPLPASRPPHPSPFLSPIISNPPSLPLVLPNKFNPSLQLRFIIHSRARSEIDSEKRKQILEGYGLNPADYISEPSQSSKMRRRRGGENPGKGSAVFLEEPKTPRTTHKLLQVLGGTARRRKLLSPKGMDVRPMMEVVRGAAFDMLQVAGGCPASLRPGRWLDLYSGTGSVGIEAMSRGCSQAHFVEMDPWVVSEVLKPNLEWTGFLNLSVIHPVRVETFLEQAEKFPDKYGSFDYISITPPYTAVDYTILMDQFSRLSLVGNNTFILVEYPLRTEMLDSCGSLAKIADRRFGRTNLAVYGPTWSQKKRG